MFAAAGVILLLILVEAFYVAAEFGAVSARRSRLRRLTEDGNRLAARLLPVVEDPTQLNRYIAASQVGITLSGLLVGAYAQAVVAPPVAPLIERWGVEARPAASIAEVIVLVGLTIPAVILGELVPKAVALHYSTEVGLFTVLPMRWSLRAYAALIWLLNSSTVALLKLVGVPNTGHRHVHSPEELELLIAESRDGGLLEPQEQVRLHRALRLGLRTARQLMVPRARLAAIDAATPLVDVLRIAASSPYSRLPVYRGTLDDIVGMLHTKDVVMHFVQRGRSGNLGSLLRPILRVPDTIPADRLLAFLRERRSHQALVVDAAGTVVGLITLEDVLSELLGNVSDELKPSRLLPIRLSDGRVRLPGALALDQARVWLEGAWPQGHETVASFIANHLESTPEAGERLTIAGVPVEIESVDGPWTSVAIVTPPSEEHDAH
jgi:magnesium and cobalt exporter, CNNM family